MVADGPCVWGAADDRFLELRRRLGAPPPTPTRGRGPSQRARSTGTIWSPPPALKEPARPSPVPGPSPTGGCSRLNGVRAEVTEPQTEKEVPLPSARSPRRRGQCPRLPTVRALFLTARGHEPPTAPWTLCRGLGHRPRCRRPFLWSGRACFWAERNRRRDVQRGSPMPSTWPLCWRLPPSPPKHQREQPGRPWGCRSGREAFVFGKEPGGCPSRFNIHVWPLEATLFNHSFPCAFPVGSETLALSP